MRNMQVIAQQQLKAVFTGLEFNAGFGLPTAKMHDLIGRRQRLVHGWQVFITHIDQQMVRAGVVQVGTGRGHGPLPGQANEWLTGD